MISDVQMEDVSSDVTIDISDYWKVVGINDVWNVHRTYEEQIAVELERCPTHAEDLAELAMLLQKKLFHQYTDVIIRILESSSTSLITVQSSEVTQCIPPLADTCLFLILPLLTKLNNSRAVSILWTVCEHLDKLDALRLLDKFEGKASAALGAIHLFTILKAKCCIAFESYIKRADDILHEIEQQLDTALGIPVIVRSAFHKTFASLYQATGRLDLFYEHAQLYLSYTPYDSIKPSEGVVLALDLAVAALVVETVHSFGELLQQPLFTFLKGTDDAWLLDMLCAFREGDKPAMLNLWEKHKQRIEMIKEFADQKSNLETKITTLAFLELCFRCPKKKITFSQVAEYCDVDTSDVEHVAVGSMAKNLVKGTIDEVEQSISISWVKPRILDNMRLTLMSERLEAWAASAQTILGKLEAASPDLFMSSGLA